MKGTGHSYQKKFADLSGMYADASAFDALRETRGDEVVYEVTDFKPNDRAGDLITGVTRMVPGQVGHEFFMTRGHIHAQVDRPEMYFVLRGKGVMQMESPEGKTEAMEMGLHTMCYVPPYWIHRSINVGTEELVMLFCYPADSGQNYDIIAQSGGMRHRVMARTDGAWELVDNSAYRARARDALGALMALGA
jgi:glucose-6-phosphate isomerase